jgi:hypothetical protein
MPGSGHKQSWTASTGSTHSNIGSVIIRVVQFSKSLAAAIGSLPPSVLNDLPFVE